MYTGQAHLSDSEEPGTSREIFTAVFLLTQSRNLFISIALGTRLLLAYDNEDSNTNKVCRDWYELISTGYFIFPAIFTLEVAYMNVSWKLCMEIQSPSNVIAILIPSYCRGYGMGTV